MEGNIEEKIDETVPEVKTVRALTAKVWIFFFQALKY